MSKKLEDNFLFLSTEEGYKKAKNYGEVDQVAFFVIQALREEISDLKEILRVQGDKIAELQNQNQNRSGDEKKSFAQMFESKSTKMEIAFMTKIRKDLQEEGRSENNIIVSGLKVIAENDETSGDAEVRVVDELLEELDLTRDNVKRQVRIKTKNEKTNLILLEFENSASRIKALKLAARLKNSVTFPGVYINKDKTKLERSADRELREERNKRNNNLSEKDEQGRPRGTHEGKKFY